MIPEEYKDSIIQNGINFMRSITEAYGSDEGMKLWDTISNSLDPDIKGQIFFVLLVGDYDSTITINQYQCPMDVDKISLIKTIRYLDKRSIGLKDAKDKVDALFFDGSPIRLVINSNSRASALYELGRLGIKP